MWWRIFVPTWRFFDVVGAHPELLVRVNGRWEPAISRPRFHWYTLFFNPTGNYYHACNNLLERLVSEIAAGAAPEQLVSFALVRDLAGGREFKVTVDGQDVLHAGGSSL
jgi:hypothetical protein